MIKVGLQVHPKMGLKTINFSIHLTHKLGDLHLLGDREKDIHNIKTEEETHWRLRSWLLAETV